MDDAFRKLMAQAQQLSDPNACKTLTDLIEAYTNEIPSLDANATDVLRRYPHIREVVRDPGGREVMAYRFGLLTGVAIFEFLLRAFGSLKTELPPYQQPGPRN